MTVTVKAILDLLLKVGLRAFDVTLCDRQKGKSAPATITVSFLHEADCARLYQALRSTQYSIGQGRNTRGHYVVTMFGC